MRWRPSRRDELPDIAATYRRVHEAWLSRALQRQHPYPQIPLKKVDDGGFSGLLATPRGRQLAQQWWTAALSRVDDVDD